ncbi:MAG: hypothetical protein FWC96_03865 [Oscillospiraceae bacterium]|nr:hypothetical protein [Oscillospiraceae bacterium]
MKRLPHILIAFVPIFVGFVFVSALFALLSFPILLYIGAWGTLLIWGAVGYLFAKWKTPMLYAILVANSIGIISVPLYAWQLYTPPFGSPLYSSPLIAHLSQMFSLPTFSLTLRITQVLMPNSAWPALAVWRQVTSLVLMMLVFTAGFIAGRLISKLQLRKSPLPQDLENANSHSV